MTTNATGNNASTKKTPVVVERTTLLWASALASAIGVAVGYGAKSYMDKRSEQKSHNTHHDNGQLSFDAHQQGMPANGSVTTSVRM